ncbi:MAG: protein kinase [Deltaproteobacteria bacterium]|nr:protein kinase [Deltaproteobacteria bacterium]
MTRTPENRSAPAGRAALTPSGVTPTVPSRAQDEARLGEVIDGRYRLDSLVGRGGMGVVYRAEHVAIRRAVALKLLHPSLAGVPELRSRFEREALAIGRINHLNCVNVSDFGKLDDGSLFLVMEYLEGKGLGDVIEKEHHLRPRRVLRILRHVLAGLGHAHQAGIVHRDIKPDNVVLVPHDNSELAKILDWGIAKMIGGAVHEDDVKLTQAGVAFGTPIYMSPEQALGSPIDGRADLYGASVMAFEMLTGRPPFYSEDKLEVMSMHTTREPPTMAEALEAEGYPGAAIPASVEALIRRGLAKRRDARFDNAEAYIAAIDEVLVELSLEDGGQLSGASPITVAAIATTSLTETGSAPLISVTGTSLFGSRPITPTVTEARLSAPVELLQRKRPWWRRQPIWIAAAGAGLAVVVAVAIVLGTSGGGAVDLPPTTKLAASAAAELDRGNPTGAIKVLEADKDALASDPAAQLQLGHAQAARRQNRPAVEAYRTAIGLDPRAGSDPQLRANLRAITDDNDVAAAMAAFEVVIGLGDDDARTRLVAAAIDGNPQRRAGAAALVARVGLSSRVDWLTSYGLDLEQGEQCEVRKLAVAKLRALGDVRAIPVLEEAVARKGKYGRDKGKPVNTCLADDAQAALVYLRSLGAPK